MVPAPSLPTSTDSAPFGRATVLFAVLAIAMLGAYWPALHGGMLWDDDAHLTPASLASAAGLFRIWTDPAASQQYYPVVGTVFWLLNKLWGHDPLGYHVVNILLHALSATLIWLLLRRWSVRGALLAAVVFALHPVHVESVAWMTELKNTFSGVLYLLAVTAYLGFDATRSRRPYALALLLFVLALGSKSVTATMPAAMLVVIWWRPGHIDWRRDVLPLLPFFVVGIAAGLGTAWLEYAWVGAQGEAFTLTLVERVLLAGRAVAFYLGKLLWPTDLVFSYPRWTIDQSVWWQYLFPLAFAAGITWLWSLRRCCRGPLAAALFFTGTLGPALGFVNVYPSRFSYVADHFQYLASIGAIALFAAGVMSLVERQRWRIPEAVIAAILALPLFLLTQQQSRQYTDGETLYRATIAQNAQSSMLHNNLAVLLLAGPASSWAEAREQAAAAVALSPDDPVAHNNLGLALQRLGRVTEGEREHRRAIELEPRLAGAHHDLGLALAAQDRLPEAAAAYEQSLRLDSEPPLVHRDYSLTLERLGRIDEALAQMHEAVRLQPDSPDLRLDLGNTLQTKSAFDEAIVAYRGALSLRPDWGEALHNLAIAISRAGKPQEAVAAFEAAERALPQSVSLARHFALQLEAIGRLDDAAACLERVLASANPDAAAELHNDLGTLRSRQGRTADAIEHFAAALRLRPDFAAAKANMEAARGR